MDNQKELGDSSSHGEFMEEFLQSTGDLPTMKIVEPWDDEEAMLDQSLKSPVVEQKSDCTTATELMTLLGKQL